MIDSTDLNTLVSLRATYTDEVLDYLRTLPIAEAQQIIRNGRKHPLWVERFRAWQAAQRTSGEGTMDASTLLPHSVVTPGAAPLSVAYLQHQLRITVDALTAEQQRADELALALAEVNAHLDTAGIPRAEGALCDDPTCRSKTGHRVHLLVVRDQQRERRHE